MEHPNYSGLAAPGVPPPPEPKDLIDLKLIIGWARLLLWFVMKRKRIPIALVIVMAIGAVAALKVLPKTYQAQTRLLATRNEYLSVDRRGAVTGSASEILHRKENLANMVRDTNLVKEWKARRLPLFRLKDELMAAIFAPMSDEDLAEVLVYMLDDNLNVEADQETVTITVDWRDPEIAYRLVNAAQAAFLEERRIQEIGLLAESTQILESHAAKLEQEIKTSIEKLRGVIKSKQESESAEVAKEEGEPTPKPKPKRVFRAARPKTAALSEADLSRIAEIDEAVESKEKTLNALVANKQQKLADLNLRLEQQRTIYKDAHPAIEDLKRQIMVAEEDPPSLARLRSEIQELKSEKSMLKDQSAGGGDSQTETLFGGGGSAVEMGNRVLEELESTPGIDLNDPDIRFAGSQVGFTINTYQNVLKRIDAARVDQEKAQAAFKHRYRIVHPAEIPPKPIKPKPAKIILGAIIGGLFVGMLIAIALELRKDLIHETWQVEGILNLPVVANVNLMGPGTSGPT